ncbi:RNA-guided endonuclease InsQ/TnpB family protein [Ktedonospora formicarum]|uniref:Transposase n=1 Tax=Ktedonospora formicarum TaxID=2778364 RepID=A0A8J3MWD4_9CHLR|nr:RNA-guided endonuclease TnpB family protein [Ktedonospora formicarum]GHO47465.1 transposase [Ktedonospora formicarum]
MPTKGNALVAYSTYEIRHHFIFTGKHLNYRAMDRRMQKHEVYRALPTKVSQQVLRLVDKNWTSFFAALRAYKEDPSRFKGRPKLPGYKDKQRGRNVLVYSIQALSRPALRKGIIKPSQLGIEVRTRCRTVDQVRIVPKGSGDSVVEVVYAQTEAQTQTDPSLVGAIDLGVNNLVALTSNKRGFVPRLVNGRPLKSVNQRYNKHATALRKKMSRNHHTSRELERVSAKRTRRLDHSMHTISRCIIDLLVAEGIGTLVIGNNPEWKQEASLGKKNNQHFVQLPHARLVSMLTYKAELVGMQVIVQEESYTSKASFLDLDPIPVIGTKEKPVFSGRRISRGLYKAKSGRTFNADVNGSYNILRKALPDAFRNGIKDVKETLVALPPSLVVHPVRIVVPLRTQKSSIR